MANYQNTNRNKVRFIQNVYKKETIDGKEIKTLIGQKVVFKHKKSNCVQFADFKKAWLEMNQLPKYDSKKQRQKRVEAAIAIMPTGLAA